MGRILITGATVLAMDEEMSILPGASIAIEGENIEAVGQEPAGQWGEVIEADGRVALPGFVNAHTHAAMTLVRGYADDLELQPWLQDKIWPMEAMLNREDVRWGTLLAIAEMLRGGITTFNDMYYFYDAVAEAVEESGMRACLSGVLLGFLPTAERDLEDAVEFANQWRGRAEGRIETMLGPHALYTVPEPLMKRVVQAAKALGVGLHIHLSESEEEVEESIRRHGLRPAAHAERLGIFEARPVLAAHCVHCDEKEIEILARRGVGVSHNPGSNMKLANGAAPVPEMLKAGVKVGLGTDGAASNNNLDLLEEARLAALLHKVTHRDPTTLPADEVLSMATRGGAAALGLDGKIGQIKPGMKADLILLDMHQPHLTPLHHVVSQIVYSARASDVRTVIVNGRIVLREGKLLTIDEEAVMGECSRRAEELARGERPRRR
jgi:5-methylthioadenosine/S-adenosylhomocysteine deaminase